MTELRVYTKENAGQFFLSPYVHVFVTNKGVAVYNTLFSTKVDICCEPNQTKEVLNSLACGATLDELHRFSNLLGVDVNTLLSNGIIE